jgi:hypothetical protein
VLRTRTAIGLTVAAASLALAQPAAADHGCSAHAEGGKVTHKTKEAHVVEKNDRWYGCAARVGRPYRLPGTDRISSVREFGDGAAPVHIRLSGVFAAYERYTVYPAGAETVTDVYVADLRTGKAVVKQQATTRRHAGYDSEVTDLVLKRNGSVGWIGRFEDPAETWEVLRFSRDGPDRGRATVASGPDIHGKSLTLSADRRKMRWREGGERRSAPLR